MNARARTPAITADSIHDALVLDIAKRAAGISDRPANTGCSAHALCGCGKAAGFGPKQAFCSRCGEEEFERGNRAQSPEEQRD